MTNGKNTQPVRKFQAGGISAALWKNSMKLKSGDEIETLSVTVERSYKDKDDNWQHSGSLRLNDVPKAMLVLNEAYEFMLSKDSEEPRVLETIQA